MTYDGLCWMLCHLDKNIKNISFGLETYFYLIITDLKYCPSAVSLYLTSTLLYIDTGLPNLIKALPTCTACVYLPVHPPLAPLSLPHCLPLAGVNAFLPLDKDKIPLKSLTAQWFEAYLCCAPSTYFLSLYFP